MLTRSSNALEPKRCSTKFTQDERARYISIKFFVEFLDYFGRFSISKLGGPYTVVDIVPQVLNRKSAQKNRKID